MCWRRFRRHIGMTVEVFMRRCVFGKRLNVGTDRFVYTTTRTTSTRCRDWAITETIECSWCVFDSISSDICISFYLSFTQQTLTSLSSTRAFVDKWASFCSVNPWSISSIRCSYLSHFLSFLTTLSDTPPSLLFITLFLLSYFASSISPDTTSEIRFSYNRMFCFTATHHPILKLSLVNNSEAVRLCSIILASSLSSSLLRYPRNRAFISLRLIYKLSPNNQYSPIYHL